MNNDIKFEEINKNIKRLLQIQDFTTLQTTILGIAFALTIFGISGLIYDILPIYKLISATLLLFLIPMLFFILVSIFSNNWEVKLDFFARAILLVLTICISLILLLIIYEVLIGFSYPFEDTPILFISWTLIASLITILLFFKIVNPLYRKRFDEIYIHELRGEPVKGFVGYIDKLIEKRMPRIAFSLFVGTFLTLFFGFFETTSNGEVRSYGVFLPWLKYSVSSTINTFDYPNFVINMFIFAFIVYIVITAWDYYKSRKK